MADHEPDACEAVLYCFAEASGYERANELPPEGLALAVTHLEAEQLPAAIRIVVHDDDDGPLCQESCRLSIPNTFSTRGLDGGN